MGRRVSWLKNLEQIRRTVAGSVRSHWSRRELEQLFGVQSRTAQGLVSLLPTVKVGPSLLVQREDLFSFLSRLYDSHDPAAELANIQAMTEEKGRAPRVKTAIRAYNKTETVTGFDTLPGNVHLAPGELRITWTTTAAPAIEALLSIADLLQHDLETFERRYCLPEPEPDDAETRRKAEEKADLEYILNWRPGMP